MWKMLKAFDILWYSGWLVRGHFYTPLHLGKSVLELLVAQSGPFQQAYREMVKHSTVWRSYASCKATKRAYNNFLSKNSKVYLIYAP
jgi:hypothetical protein